MNLEYRSILGTMNAVVYYCNQEFRRNLEYRSNLET